MKKTFKELQEVDMLVGGMYQKNPELKNSKFGYAYKRFTDKNYMPVVTEFNDELTALRIQHAMEDPTTKEVLMDRMNPRGYKYTKAGLTQVMFEEKKLTEKWNLKEIDIVPFLSALIPEGLEEEQQQMLSGLVL